MNRSESSRVRRDHRRRQPGAVFWLTAAALLLWMAATSAPAQNAAQRAALAKLSTSRTGAHPQNAQPSGVEATTLPLLTPGQLAFDAAGNLYIADTGDNLVRLVSLAGAITTVAGSGQEGFSGDGGPAVNAQFDSPTGVAIDASGNLYIADTNNNRIREVSGGLIRTIAGTGPAGFLGDGDAASAAQLDLPGSLTTDGQGNLYIADTGNQRIRKITGAIITTAAGNGMEGFTGDGAAATSASLDGPLGIAVDKAGNLYISDTHNQRVRMVSASTGNITTIAGTGAKGYNGDGPALNTALASPSGLGIDTAGDVYFADSDNNRVREIIAGNIVTVAGIATEGYGGDTGAATSALLDTPRDVVVGTSGIVLSDTGNNLVRSVAAGSIVSLAGVPAPASESLIIGGASANIYGTGMLTASFSSNGGAGTGQVSFYDEQLSPAALVGQAQLVDDVASISTRVLSAGTHSIVASYGGNAENNPINSGVYIVSVTPASLTATANSVDLLYGQTIPSLTGTLSGVLAQDLGRIMATYTTAATFTSPPGAYPITVALTGPAAANYKLTNVAGSGSVLVGRAPTATILSSSPTDPLPGTSVTLTATVTAATSAVPGGSVNFYNGTQVLSPTPIFVSGGRATFTVHTLAAGTQSLTAVYNGNVDFVGSTSDALPVTAISPEFTLAASPDTQTVKSSGSVEYALRLSPVNSTFVNPVTLTASGLPADITSIFAPASVAAGSGVSEVTLTLSANAQASLGSTETSHSRWNQAILFALLLPLVFWRRKGSLSGVSKTMIALIILMLTGAMTACGGGHPKVYTVTITAASAPGIRHTVDVNLVVQ